VALTVAAIAAANWIFGVSYSAGQNERLRALAAGCSVLPVLILFVFADQLLPSFFRYDPSGQTLARELQLRKIPSDQLSVYAMSRGQHYSLNFYLRTEIKDWDRRLPGEGYVLTNSRNCKYLAIPEPNCKEIPIDVQHTTGTLLYKLTRNSAANAAGGGKAQ
jgi:hypothetical protein